MANEVNLGRLGFVIKGTATVNTAYKRLDVLDDGNGNVYVSLKDQTLRSLSDLKPGNNWYRWTKSNDTSIEPIANATSEGLIFCDTDDSKWFKNLIGRNGNQSVSGHKEVIIIPDNIVIGETVRGFIVKLKHNCEFLCINRNEISDYNNATTVDNVILPGDDVFMENDVWIFYINYMTSGTLNYTASRIYREPKVVSCEAFATCEWTQQGIGIEEKRLSIHPMGELGKLKPNITYQFRCHCISAGIRLWNIVEMANGGSIDAEYGFTKFKAYRFKKHIRIIPSYFDFMSDIKGDASHWKINSGTSSYKELIYENGRIDLGPNVEVRFPQLYEQYGYGKLNKLTIPIGESFTIILVPNYVFPSGRNNCGYESIENSYWKVLIYFDNIDKIVTVGNPSGEQPGTITPDPTPNPEPGSDLAPDDEWPPYDLTGDKIIDVEDVNLAINFILGLNKRTDDRSLHNTEGTYTFNGRTRTGILKYIPDAVWNQIISENDNLFDVEVVNKLINRILKLTTVSSDQTNEVETIITIQEDPEDPDNNVIGLKPRWNAEHITIGDLDFSGLAYINDWTIMYLYTEDAAYYFGFEPNDEPFDITTAVLMPVNSYVSYYWRQYMEEHGMTYDEFEEFVLTMPETVNNNNKEDYGNVINSLISDLADINRDGIIDETDLNLLEAHITAISNGNTPPASNIGKSLKVIMSEDNTASQNNIAPFSSVIDGSIGFIQTDATMNKLDDVEYNKSNVTIKQSIRR